jgi:hypothetical protein
VNDLWQTAGEPTAFGQPATAILAVTPNRQSHGRRPGQQPKRQPLKDLEKEQSFTVNDWYDICI